MNKVRCRVFRFPCFLGLSFASVKERKSLDQRATVTLVMDVLTDEDARGADAARVASVSSIRPHLASVSSRDVRYAVQSTGKLKICAAELPLQPRGTRIRDRKGEYE